MAKGGLLKVFVKTGLSGQFSLNLAPYPILGWLKQSTE
jgi:hypothetical protein